MIHSKMAPYALIFISSAALLSVVCAAGPKTLRVSTIKEEPYAMSKGSELEGFCIDLLSALSKKLDFKYNIQVVKDGRYGITDESGHWTGMIGEIVRGEADIAVAPLTVTAKREAVVEMTKPFMQTGLSFILRKDQASDESQFFSLLNLFSTEMWIGVLVAYLLTSVCIFLVARISPCEWGHPETEQNSFTLSHSFWYTVGALTLQGAGPHPRALSGRIITSIWWLFSLVLLVSYFANLSSWLHSDSQQLSIKSFEDLANQNVIEYGTIKDSSSFAFFKNSNNPTYQRIYEHIKNAQSYSLNAAEGFRRALKGNYAFIGESVSLDLAVARYCNLTRAPEIIGMRGYSIAAPLGSPLVKNLSVGILGLSESGELDYFRSKWWASSCVAKSDTSAPLKASSLKGIFLLLAFGLGLGLLIALMELAAKSRAVAKSEQKSCCSVLSAELSRRFRGGEITSPESVEKNKA